MSYFLVAQLEFLPGCIMKMVALSMICFTISSPLYFKISLWFTILKLLTIWLPICNPLSHCKRDSLRTSKKSDNMVMVFLEKQNHKPIKESNCNLLKLGLRLWLQGLHLIFPMINSELLYLSKRLSLWLLHLIP